MASPDAPPDLTPWVGIWVLDEGYQITELLVRSDGRYQLDTTSTDPNLTYSSAEHGRFEIAGQQVTLAPYDYFGEPLYKTYEWQFEGESLSLTTLEYVYTQVFQFKRGSRVDVLAREKVGADLIRTWGRRTTFYGIAEYTFRPGGYYFLKSTPIGGQFPPEFLRGRYRQDGTRLTLNPYGGIESVYELDFFGTTLTLIAKGEFHGESATYHERTGSAEDVNAKAAEAEAFLNRENWQVGVWEIRDRIQTVDLTVRPDGYYIAREDTEFLAGIVRGRYVLEPRRIRLSPFVGQGLYTRSNGEFGKVERVRELDYYDGELQFIDLEAISQSVTIARKRPGSDAPIIEKVREARLERQRPDWHIGVWEVNDPAGWMEFTWRPDRRYIASSGTDGVASKVERGWYHVATEKVTLAPVLRIGSGAGIRTGSLRR